MTYTRKLILVLFGLSLTLGLTACGLDDNDEPTAEEIAKEILNAPKSPDGKTVDDKNLAKTTSLKCIGTNTDQNLSSLGYEIVIDIDKSTNGQRMVVYYQGQRTYEWLVSTGAETPKKTKAGHISQRHTPVGFFTPNLGRLYENYYSQTWKTDMPYAIFFSGGVAIHAAARNKIAYLGERDSGGCVRLDPSNAETLFQLVKNQVGMGLIAEVDRNGCIRKDANGQVRYKKGYRTLIVVHE